MELVALISTPEKKEKEKRGEKKESIDVRVLTAPKDAEKYFRDSVVTL